MWRKLVYVAVAALIPVCWYIAARNRRPEATGMMHRDLTPEAKRDFEQLVLKARDRATTPWFTELCAEFKITDPIEAELWGAPMIDAEGRFFGLCFVKPSPKLVAMEQFTKVANGVHLKYARVTAPVSRPLGIFIGGKDSKDEFAYDVAARQWKQGTGIVNAEDAAVRKKVAEALRSIQPDGRRPK